MSWLRNAFSGKAAETEKPLPLSPADVTSGIGSVSFDQNNSAEAKLAKKWSSYKSSLTIDGQANAAFRELIAEFNSTFESWVPEETRSYAMTQSGASASRVKSRGREQVAAGSSEVVGCSVGHPRELLQAMVDSLASTPQDISAVLRRDPQDPGVKPLEEAGALLKLIALNIAAKSHHNRKVLLSIGCLPALLKILKVSIMRLNTLAAIAAVESNMNSVNWQLAFLGGNLAATVSVLDTFMIRELQYWNGMARFLGQELDPSTGEVVLKPLIEEGALSYFVELLRSLWLLRARGGQAATAPGLDALVLASICTAVQASSTAQKHLHSVGGLEVLLDGIGWPADQPRLGHAAGQQASSLLGDEVPQMSSIRCRPASEELRAQLKTLEVVGHAVRRNNVNMVRVRELGGFRRVTQLLQWVALTFSAEDNAEAASAAARGGGGGRAGAGGSGSPAMGGRKPGTSAAQAMLQQDLPEAHAGDLRSLKGFVELQEVFGVLLDAFMGSAEPEGPTGAANFGRGGGKGVHQGGGGGLLTGVVSDRLLLELLGALLEVFREEPTPVPGLSVQASETMHHRAAARALRSATCTLQRFTLALLNEVLKSRPSLLDALRHMGVWEVLGGPAFFFFGNEGQFSAMSKAQAAGVLAASRRQLLLSVNLVPDEARREVRLLMGGSFGAVTDGAATDSPGSSLQGKRPVPRERIAALREHVVAVMEAFAGLAAKGSTGDECSKLAEVLNVGALEEDVVLLLSPALRRLLSVVPETTIQSLQENDTLGLIARAIVHQQEAEREQHPGRPGGADAEEMMLVNSGTGAPSDALMLWRARCAMISLLVAYLDTGEVVRRKATGHNDVVKALLGLLWERKTRSVALSQLVTLMCTAPDTEEDRVAKMRLFVIFTEALPMSRSLDPEDRFPLLVAILDAVQKSVASDPAANQSLFRHTAMLSKVAELLDGPVPPSEVVKLLEAVLRTLRALVTGSEAGRAALEEQVGYERLRALLLRPYSEPEDEAAPGDGASDEPMRKEAPPLRIFMCLMDLVLEKEYEAEASNQVVANPRAITLFFDILREAPYQLQVWGLDVWCDLVNGCMANRSALEAAGANRALLDWMAASSGQPQLQERIAGLLQATAGHSVSAADLHMVLELLGNRSTAGTGCATLLLSMLRKMAKPDGPPSYFDLGDPASGIVRTTPLRWPSRGYSFATWIRAESCAPGTAPHRTLFSFLRRSSGQAQGVVAFLQGQQLCFCCVGKSPGEVLMPFRLEARRWYSLAIVHTAGGALSSAGITLYINGQQVAASKLRYPKVSDALNYCCIGGRQSAAESGVQRQLAAFSGQLGAIYLFDECLSLQQVQSLHAIGPEYCGVFAPMESSAVLQQARAASSVLLESKEALWPLLIMSYNPNSVSGRMAFDAVVSDLTHSYFSGPSSGSGANRSVTRQIDAISTEGGASGVGSAALLEGTAVCRAHRLQDMLFCIGGVAVFLPLLDGLKGRPEEGSEGSSSSSSSADAEGGGDSEEWAGQIVGLLAAVLEGSLSNRLQFSQMGGPGLLGQLLQCCPPRHLTTELLKALEKLFRILVTNGDDVGDVAAHLLFNLRLWARAPPAVQRQYHATLMRMARDEQDLFRAHLSPARLLDAVRRHYSEVYDTDGEMSPEDLRALRRGLLDVGATMVRAAAQEITHPSAGSQGGSSAGGRTLRRNLSGGSKSLTPAEILGGTAGVLSGDDVAAYLCFVAEVEDWEAVEDVLDSLVSLLQPGSTTRQQVRTVISALGGISMLLPLLRLKAPGAREMGLHVLLCLRPECGQQPGAGEAAEGAPSHTSGTPGETLRPMPSDMSSAVSMSGGSLPGTPSRRLTGADSDTWFGLLDSGADWGEMFWEEITTALLSQPVTAGMWRLLMSCLEGSRGPWQSSSAGRRAAAQQDGGTLPRIAVLVMAGLRQGERTHDQRCDALNVLLDIIEEGNPAFVGCITLNPKWYEGILNLLKDGGPISPSEASRHEMEQSPSRPPRQSWDGMGSVGWAVHDVGEKVGAVRKHWHWVGKEANLVRRLLCSSITNAIRYHKGGWRPLEHLCCSVRSAALAGVIDGWGLLMSALGDVVAALLAVDRGGRARSSSSSGLEASPALDDWVTVPTLGTPPCRDNVAGLVALLDEQLVGVLLNPQSGKLPGAPSVGAVQWAERASAGAGDLPLRGEVWSCLGGPPIQGKRGYEGHWEDSWELCSKLLKLLEVLQRDREAGTPSPAGPAPRPRSSGGLISFLSQEPAPDPSGDAAAADPGVILWAVNIRSPRLLFRLLLLYMQQAPLDVATSGVAAVIDALPKLLTPSSDTIFDMVHYMVYALSWARDCLDPYNSVGGSLNSRVASMLGHESSGEARMTLARRAFSQVFDCVRETLAITKAAKAESQGKLSTGTRFMVMHLDPNDGEALSEVLEDARILRHVSREVLYMGHMSKSRLAAVHNLGTVARGKAEETREALHVFQGSLRERMGGLCAADRGRRIGLRMFEDEQSHQLARSWRRLQRRLAMEKAFRASSSEEWQMAWKLDRSEDSSRRRMKLKPNHKFTQYLNERGADADNSVAPPGEEHEEDEEGAPGALGRELSLEHCFSLPKEFIRAPCEDDSLASPGKELLERSDSGLRLTEDGPGAEGSGAEGQEEPGSRDPTAPEAECLPSVSGEPGEPTDAASGQQAEPRPPAEEAEEGSGPTTRDSEGKGGSSASQAAAEGSALSSGAVSEPGQTGNATAAVPAEAEAQGTASRHDGSPRQQEVVAGDVRSDSAASPEPTNTAPGEEEQQQKKKTATNALGTVPSVQSFPLSDAPSVSNSEALSRTASMAETGDGNEGGMSRAASMAETADAAALEAALQERPEDLPRVMNGEEVVLHSAPCTLVCVKYVSTGRLELTRTHLHFSGDREQPRGADDLGSTVQQQQQQQGRKRLHRRWQLGQVAQVHHARYMLQVTALEIFMKDRSSVFFDFYTKDSAMEISNWCSNLAPSAVVYDRRKKLELAERLASRWRRWEISNFDYLMQLNTLAGRTFNDLNQYPVFPWILADYTSDSLDLDNPASFRDLTRPVGALNDKQREVFKERYESLKDDMDTPAFHYGSHYSTSGIVLYYMLRMEPMTFLARQLQGSQFDHADRMFHSVAETWANLKASTSDTKELIPEMYCNPEVLVNSNGFDLGRRQDGQVLGDVLLPPWANGSAQEFIRVMREALESEHASAHLHEWIDLVFGFKQRGKAAEEAVNVFFYLTYEGAVDLDAIDDPEQRGAIRDQIGNFGQTPMQLFKRRHVKRGPPPPPSVHPLLNAPEVMIPLAAGFPTGEKRAPIVGLAVAEQARLVMVTADCLMLCHKWISPRRDSAFAFGGESTFSIEIDPNPPRRLRGIIDRRLPREHLSSCVSVSPSGRVVLTGGHLDGSLRATMVDDGRLLQVLVQHKDVVTAVDVSKDGSAVVTGSRDTNVIIWDTNLPEMSSQRESVATRRQRLLPIRDQPRVVVYGHRAEVTCAVVSTELQIVGSGSKDGLVLIHTLGEGLPVHSLRMPEGSPPSLMAVVEQQALMVVHSHEDMALHSFTVNGRHVATVGGSEPLHCCAVSPCGRFLLLGGDQGIASLLTAHDLETVIGYDVGHGAITSLTITPEECLMIGSTDGSLSLFAPDTRRHITRRLQVLGKVQKAPVAAQLSSGT